LLYLYCRDVDQVHDMMDDIAEQQDVAREISDAISNPVAFGQDADEDELSEISIMSNCSRYFYYNIYKIILL